MSECIYTSENDAARTARLAEINAKNEKFTLDDFGGAPSKMVSTYAKPPYYPRAARPRIFLTGDMIPKIKDALKNTEYSGISEIFWKSANTVYYTPNPQRVKLPESYLAGAPYEFDGSFVPLEITGTTYNWDGKVLGIIEAKALAYLLTGCELYGREAIYFIKNAIRTLHHTKDLFIDPFRAYSLTMLIAAEVYDWCNDLMSDADKEQLISGCEHYLCLWDPDNFVHNMEIGFPPSLGGSVSGHTISVMLFRDYLAMAASIYEDHPDWWEFCAGRFFEQYLEPANVALKGGLTSQGTACYCHNKLHTFLSSAWVLKNATGVMPYDKGMGKVMSSILGHMLPNGKLFETGDGPRSGDGTETMGVAGIVISAALFPDKAVQANAKYYSKNYTAVKYFINEVTESQMLIFCANAVEPAADRLSAISKVSYNGYPFGQMIAHNTWDKDGAAAFMKIGVFTSANHDQRDSGTFQLYHKSLLLTSSGTYNYYGNNHHVFYHQDTIAQNGLLVFNPEMHDPNANPDGTREERGRYWYSGGQRVIGEPYSMDIWFSGKYDFGTVTGYASDYFDGKTENPTYAYIAGDITKAYDTDRTVDRVERRMLTAFTENNECPMVFLTYDKITSKKPEFKKTYLLHPTAEPEIAGNTITVVNGDGKLVFNTLKGTKKIEKIGGEGKAFMINGVNCPSIHRETGVVAPENSGAIWGRVELSAEGERDTEFFNIMYATDAKNEKSEEISQYESDKLLCAQALGVCAAFVRASERTSEDLEFPVAENNSSCYVSGVAAGEWKLTADGKQIGTVVATSDGGFLAFKADKCNLKLTKI